jgi:aspartyl-tRNA(Asn)/glutamyl-tRNA(Gln) amidotransferase subunit B
LIKLVGNWLINKFLPALAERNIAFAENKVTPENFAEFITLVYQSKINSTNAQLVLSEMIATGADPSNVLAEKDLGSMDSKDDLEVAVAKVINANPAQSAEFKAGKEPVLKFFIGLVMRETKGKADPGKIEEMLREKLR